MTILEIMAQIANFIGTTLNMIGINMKDKRKVLLFFIFGDLFVATSLGLLNAHIGMFAQIIFTIEAIINYFYEKKHDKYPIWLVILYVLIPCAVLAFAYESLWDFLPLIGAIFFPLALVSHNFKLRLINLLSVIVWIPYNYHFGQYVGAIGCTIFTLMNVMAIIRLDICKKKDVRKIKEEGKNI